MNQFTKTALITLAMATTAICQIISPQPNPRRPIQRPLPVPQALRATLLQVQTSIVDGIATTELRQTIHNSGGRIAEATWILPLPTGSTADHFTMKVGNTVMDGEVLDAKKAKKIYEDIVRRQQDPGLLEYFGKGCLRARVFPIPARGSIEVRVRYRQILDESGGLHRWDFPLRAAGLPGKPSERVTLDLKITSRSPILNVYSPLSGVDVIKKGDHEARATFELKAGQMPARDLSVFYGVSTKAFGLDLLPWSKGGGKGYFMMLVSPRHDWPEPKNTIKVVQFVVDTSGSMQGKKIEQAKAALRFFVRSLKSNDYFNIIPFSTEARPFFDGPVKVEPATIEKAMSEIADLQARGGTNIEDALTTALKSAVPSIDGKATVVPITVFLTDGLPTVGTTNVEILVKQTAKANQSGSRVFVFGVGDDVNTQLLDKIAKQSRGDRDYVREHENIEVKTSALFTKLSNPVMTGLELHIDGITLKDRYPRDLPDLFKGSRLIVVGRYVGHGHKAIRLSGMVDGTKREYVFEASFAAKDTQHDFVPVIWAQRRVAVLLEAIRLNGSSKELVDEVRRIGREFSIVTPFTSHLIVEDNLRVSRARGIRTGLDRADGFFLGDRDGRERTVQRLQRDLARIGAVTKSESKELAKLVAKTPARSAEARANLLSLNERSEGAQAVDNSIRLGALMKSRKYGRVGGKGGAPNLTSVWVQGRNFHLAGGIWVEDCFVASMRGKERRVKAFSTDYFALLTQHPELGPFLAFSTAIVLVVDGKAIEVY